MAPFDPKVYRNTKDGIGMPGDDRATDDASAWTVVALLKGLYHLLSGGITVTLPVTAATAANQTTEIASLASIDGHVDGVEASLASILAKIIAAPSTEAKQDTGNTSLASIATLLTTQAGYLDGIEGLIGTTNSKDFATQTTLAAVLAKLIAAPATEAKQDATITKLTAGAAAIAKAEDAASADADVGIPAMAILKATPADTAGTDGDYQMLQMKSGRLWVSAVLEAAAVAIGKLAANSGVVIGAVENNTVATAGGVASTSRLLSAAASTNAASVKASAGRLYKMQGYNAATSVRYLKLYNKASAPTVGSDTPVRTIALPPSCAFDLDWANLGYYFATGIAYALTTGSADADTGALTAGDILALNMDYV